MDLTVTAMVLLAALLHAGWNAIYKGQGSGLATGVVITFGMAGASALALPFVPIPAPESWGYFAASVALHLCYRLFLSACYRYGDLGQVYPISRGTGPLLVTIVSFYWLGEKLPAQVMLGIIVVIIGIVSLAFRGGGISAFHAMRPVLLAIGTGIFIAAYTIADGLGARLAGTPHGYIFWLMFVDSLVFVPVVGYLRRDTILQFSTKDWLIGLGGGVMALTAYWLFVWAMTLAPIAPAAALRETSVIFAAIIGALFLKESFGKWRILAAVTVTIGVVLMRL
ncbi:MAG: EamA family transporter [Rhodospirillaceae bacterium]|nr:EamA family transporter [Rhodospirillaceae bacterium]